MHIFGNPVKEMSNKLSPVVQEVSRLVTGVSGGNDPYTGKTIIDKNAPGWRQTSQAFGNILENLATPFGYGIANTQGSSPAVVNGAKLFGFGASASDYNPIEKDIMNQYYATLPSGTSKVPPAMTALEATARNDLAKGNKNSIAVQQLQKTMTPTAFNRFMKTGADSTPQRAWAALSTQAKLNIIEKYSPAQLKEFDMTLPAKTLTGSSAKTVITSLQSKGYTPQRIAQDFSKAGINQSQLLQIKAEAKRQASIKARAASHNPKFKNPLL